MDEYGLQLQDGGSWYPHWDDRSEASYSSGSDTEAQLVQAAMLQSLQELPGPGQDTVAELAQAAMLTSLRESAELQEAVEASVHTVTAMEETPSQRL